MFQRIVTSSFLIGTLFTAMLPATGFAQRGRAEGQRGGGSASSGRSPGQSARGFSGGGTAPNRSYSGQAFSGSRGPSVQRRDSGGRSFWGGAYLSPRFYGRRPEYRGYYRGNGIYPGYGGSSYGGYYGYYDPGYAYYGYSYAPVYSDPGYYDPGYYDPGYYDPGYSAPDPRYSTAPPPPSRPPVRQQGCSPGAYDEYGRWIPNPNCSQPQQQNYYSNPQQYPQQQRNYDPAYPLPRDR